MSETSRRFSLEFGDDWIAPDPHRPDFRVLAPEPHDPDAEPEPLGPGWQTLGFLSDGDECKCGTSTREGPGLPGCVRVDFYEPWEPPKPKCRQVQPPNSDGPVPLVGGLVDPLARCHLDAGHEGWCVNALGRTWKWVQRPAYMLSGIDYDAEDF